MQGSKIYRITDGGYTPEGKWSDYPHLMDFRHAANVAARKIRDADDETFEYILRSGFTVWGGPLEVVELRIDGKVTYDRELEPAEGAYIAQAIVNAIRDRRATVGR